MRGRRIELAGLHVRAGDASVLRDLDLEVGAGTTTAVLGASGVGKTTLLRAIAGLVPVDDGTVHFDGVDVTGLPPERRDVGLVFQDHLLFPHRSVAGNVGFGPRLRGEPPGVVDDIVTTWLERVGLPGLGDRDVHTLSGGQRQRVTLARALAPSPGIVLLDEPLGALDTGLRDDLSEMVRDLLGETGATALLVTHDPVEATGLADRIAILEAGRIVQVGAPREVWERPVTVTAARLMGHVNLLPSSAVPRAPGDDRRPDDDRPVLIPEDAPRLTDPTDPEATTRATVTASSLRGPHRRVVVALADGTRLTVVVDRRIDPAIGESCGVVLDAADAVPLKR